MKRKLKIGELNFELTIPENDEAAPYFEIENDASMIFEKLEVSEAVELKKLIELFIKKADQFTDKSLAKGP